jgi:hypothetical protein
MTMRKPAMTVREPVMTVRKYIHFEIILKGWFAYIAEQPFFMQLNGDYSCGAEKHEGIIR